MPALEPYYFELNILQLRNESIEDSEVVNRLEKNRFRWPCEGCPVSCRLFSLPPISGQTQWLYINTAWLPSQLQNDGLQSLFFRDQFLIDDGHFRGWDFGEWKSWMFTCKEFCYTFNDTCGFFRTFLFLFPGVGRERMEFPTTQPPERDHRVNNGNTRRKDSDCVIL